MAENFALYPILACAYCTEVRVCTGLKGVAVLFSSSVCACACIQFLCVYSNSFLRYLCLLRSRSYHFGPLLVRWSPRQDDTTSHHSIFITYLTWYYLSYESTTRLDPRGKRVILWKGRRKLFYEECNGKKTELGLRGIVIYSSVSLRQFVFSPSNNLGSEEPTWKVIHWWNSRKLSRFYSARNSVVGRAYVRKQPVIL